MPPDLRWHPRALAAALRNRFRALFTRGRVEREFNEELQFHLEMEIERHRAAGKSPEEARRLALISFGGIDRVTEAHRDARGVRAVQDALSDLRLATRVVSRSPGFVLVSIMTLAIAVAIGTALFTGANAFFYRPLSVPDGARLLSVFTSDFSDRTRLGASSYADIVDFAQQVEPIADLAGESRIMLALTVNDDVALIQGAVVSSRYFRVVGIRPFLGSLPPASGAAVPSIVLSHALWRRTFGSDSSIIGRSLRVNGQPFTVLGIAPPAFRGTSREVAVDFWIDAAFSPLVLLHEEMLHRRGNRNFHVIGRLRPDATIEQLNARLSLLGSRLAAVDPQSWRDTTGQPRVVVATRERDAHLAAMSRADRVMILGAVVAFGLGLIAIACANLASMQLARGASRRREIATRLALGAGRGRLIRQLLAECALIAVPGIAAGVGLAMIGANLISEYRPIPLPSLDLALDWRAISFIGGTLLLTLVTFGLVPALQTVRADLLTDLKGGDEADARGLRIGRMRGGLIVIQVALSVVFTATAGLVLLALQQHAREVRGDAPKVLITRIDFLPAAGDSMQVGALERQMIESLRDIPGVEGVSAATFVPVRGSRRTVDAEVHTEAGESRRRVLDATEVFPGYFGVVGSPLLRGRDFDQRDLHERSAVIVTRAMADALWPGEDAIGKVVRLGEGDGATAGQSTVVGIVADPAGWTGATDQSYPGLLYLPLRPMREAEVVLHVRAPTAQAAVASEVARRLRDFNTRLVAPRVITLSEYLDQVVLPQRLLARAAGVIAALQLLLAIAGLSGLVAHVTAQRRREIGIRRALGATSRNVLTLVLRQGVKLTLAGAGAGLALSVIVARVVAESLPVSTQIMAGGLMFAAMTFALVSTVAMYLPARAAIAVEPGTALRVD